jgi:predicted nucleotidyltransferase
MTNATAVTRHGITLPSEQIGALCRHWKIRELATFGSFLRDDFRPDSDYDLDEPLDCNHSSSSKA